MFFEPHLRDKSVLRFDPFKALIAPRPIGWVSTMDREGRVNLAPYSFFNALSSEPPIVGFCSEGVKDTVAFARDTGEFVWNMATWELRNQMNETSSPLERGQNEFVHAGLEATSSMLVRPPRVKASPAHLECKVVDIFHLKDINGNQVPRVMVIGQVIGIHIDDNFIDKGFVQITKMKPIARCGYQDYAVLDEVFIIKRPEGGGNIVAGG